MKKRQQQKLLNTALAMLGYIPPRNQEELLAFEELHKNYVPRIQKTVRDTNKKHTGIKMVNHFGDNNPFPYNSISIKLSFLYRLICVIVHIFINLIRLLNIVISTIGAPFCWLANLKLPLVGRPFGKILDWLPSCIPLSSDFCDDGINKNVTYPGCGECLSDNSS